VTINDALPPKAIESDATAKLKSILGLQIWAANKPNAFSFRFAVGCHVYGTWSLCDGLGQNRIL